MLNMNTWLSLKLHFKGDPKLIKDQHVAILLTDRGQCCSLQINTSLCSLLFWFMFSKGLIEDTATSRPSGVLQPDVNASSCHEKFFFVQHKHFNVFFVVTTFCGCQLFSIFYVKMSFLLVLILKPFYLPLHLESNHSKCRTCKRVWIFWLPQVSGVKTEPHCWLPSWDSPAETSRCSMICVTRDSLF